MGKVSKIYVSDGDFVHKGDVLVQLDTSEMDASMRKDERERTENEAAAAICRTLLKAIDTNSSPPLESASLPTDRQPAAIEEYRAQLREFRVKMSSLAENERLAQEELPVLTREEDDYKELSDKNEVPLHEYLERVRSRMELERQIAQMRTEQNDIAAEEERKVSDTLVGAEAASFAAAQDVAAVVEHRKLFTLTSPVDGTVQQLQAHTLGGVVPPAQPVMLVAPSEGSTEIEAEIEAKDIGFVHEGQAVDVTVDAFDYTRFGTLDGKVKWISRDAMRDEHGNTLYAASIQVERSYFLINGVKFSIKPGMTGRAAIKTGRRRIIDYLLSPLKRTVDDSFRER
jgi:hemolysin D